MSRSKRQLDVLNEWQILTKAGQDASGGAEHLICYYSVFIMCLEVQSERFRCQPELEFALRRFRSCVPKIASLG